MSGWTSAALESGWRSFADEPGACFVEMLATGSNILVATHFMAQLVQEDCGCTATWTGPVLSPGVNVSVFAIFETGRPSQRVQPKSLIAMAATSSALSMFLVESTCGDIDFWFFANNHMLIGVGLPPNFAPVTAASYYGLPDNRTEMVSALLNSARDRCGTIGSSTTESQQKVAAWIGDQIQQQASLLAYLDVFWTWVTIARCPIPLALWLREVKLGGRFAIEH